jgi:hypothetical protein
MEQSRRGRAEPALLLALGALLLAGCAHAEPPATSFQRRVGMLCYSMASQLRAVVRETALGVASIEPGIRARRLPHRVEAEVLRDVARTERVADFRGASRSAEVVDSIREELKRVPVALSHRATEESLERSLSQSAARLRALAASVRHEPASRRPLAAFMRRYAAAARSKQWREACSAAVHALDADPNR